MITHPKTLIDKFFACNYLLKSERLLVSNEKETSLSDEIGTSSDTSSLDSS